jgi:tRNA dimethylallyltransferase
MTPQEIRTSHRPVLLTITGPTACGKTALAVECAYRLNGEIISADSRQVFRGMDIGTGKDLKDYDIHGVHIPYHLIDIHEAGYEYNVYQFQNDFITAFNDIVSIEKTPIMCGGTGLYVESIVRGYALSDAPVSPSFRKSIEGKSDEELAKRLSLLVKLHNHTDTETHERLVRALEIAEYQQAHPENHVQLPNMEHVLVGVSYPRAVVVERIGLRLKQRLEEGMIEEVQNLIQQGVPTERLLRYGLEYKHITRYLLKQCSYQEMFENLYTDIRRFSKRQMTWFRRMERNGMPIHWVDGNKTLADKVDEILSLYTQKSLEHHTL